MSGILYVVATPIGNLEDITLRAVRILGEVDLIAAEDTRKSSHLLNHLQIKKPLTSYFEHNKRKKGEYIINELTAGKNVALISDAGMPGISDPGVDLIKQAIESGIEVTVLPGASAGLTALVSSGLDTARFFFEGFLPKEKSARKQRLQELLEEQCTQIFYESPHRVSALLAEMNELIPERRISVARELTKRFEEIKRGTVSELCEYYEAKQPKGEFVLILAGATQGADEEVDDGVLGAELEGLMQAGIPRKEASKQVAKKYAVSAKRVYDLGLKHPCS